MSGLSTYEVERQKNIKNNEKKLAALGAQFIVEPYGNLDPCFMRESSRLLAGKNSSMKKRHRAKQIVAKLRQGDVELGEGLRVPEVCRQLGISDSTHS